MMYRTGLVPRGMAMLGLVGGPLIVLSGTAVIFGVIEAGSTAQTLASIPEFFWELSFGIYLIVKGFKPSRHHRRHGGRTMITVEAASAVKLTSLSGLVTPSRA